MSQRTNTSSRQNDTPDNEGRQRDDDPRARGRHVRAEIQRHLDAGRAVVTYAKGRNHPAGKNWGAHPVTRDRLADGSDADWDCNIGLLTGEASGNLYDVDADCDEAVTLAAKWLPPTEMVHGRTTRPRTHYWFAAPDDAAQGRRTYAYAELLPDGVRSDRPQTYLELRGGKAPTPAFQTTIPPSIHTSGDQVRWDKKGMPATVAYADLDQRVRLIAAATLLVRHWPSKCHEATLALVGALARIWERDSEIVEFVSGVLDGAGHAGHETGLDGMVADARTRLSHGTDAAAQSDDDDTPTPTKVKGWPALADALRDGTQVVEKFRKWLPGANQHEERARFRAQVQASLEGMPLGDDGLPQICVTNRPLRDKSADALAALLRANEPPVVWARSGSLIRLREDDADACAAPITEILDGDMLCGRLTRVADFLKVVGFGVEHVDPPAGIVKDVMKLGTWSGLSTLLGIVQVPVLRSDGTILSRPGYDVATRLFYAPAPGLHIPDIPANPTALDIAQARDLLDGETLGGFPFVDQASRTNAVALLLSPVVRPAIDGLVPLAIVDSPKPGTGKGLLSEINALISTGNPTPSVLDYIDEEREMDKRLTTILAKGPAIILLDNIDTPIRSGRLSSALTLREWEGRMIGYTRQIRAPQRAVWVATGNNVQLAGDMPRRCYWIRLDSKLAHPEYRGADHFRGAGSHYPLQPWVTTMRGELIAALLTLARAWFAAGKPAGDIPIMGSFEAWTQTIGGILTLADYEDFLGNRQQLQEQVATADREWGLFLGGWHQYTRNPAEAITDDPADREMNRRIDVTPWISVGDLVMELGKVRKIGPDGDRWPRLEELLPTTLLRVNEEVKGSKTLGSSEVALTAALGKALAARVNTPFEDPTTKRTLRVERWDRGSRKTFWRVVASV